jgi:hypothetical protein
LIRERTIIRLVFAWFTLMTALVSIFMWTGSNSATDWGWFYRFALPVAAGFLAWGAIRPRIVGMAWLFWPLAAVATIRVIDFTQDWYLTPSDHEPVDLARRLLLGAYGWSMVVGFVILVETLERLLTARYVESDAAGQLCWNAPGCPSHSPVIDPMRRPPPNRHRQRSVRDPSS